MCIQIVDLSVSGKVHLWALISSAANGDDTTDLKGLFLGLNEKEWKAHSTMPDRF